VNWLTWRVHRNAAYWIVASAIVAIATMTVGSVAIAVATHGGCLSARCTQDDLAGARVWIDLSRWLLVAFPAAFGVFMGAAVIPRERQDGTLPFTWGQDASPREWLWKRVALLLVFAVALSVIIAALAWAWVARISQLDYGVNQWDLFDIAGLTPVAYAVFGLGIGVFVGMVIRSVVGALAATALAFVFARAGMLLIRWHLAPVEQAWYPATTPHGAPAGAVMLADNLVDRAGALVSALPSGSSLDGLYERVTYQPATHFWAIQGAEAAIFITAGMVAFCACALLLRRLVRHRF
jgi:hypothetical protein